jgi:DNA primase
MIAVYLWGGIRYHALMSTPSRPNLQPTIDAIRSRVSLVEIFQQHGVTLKKQGNDYVACCPFHQEKSPSCHVYAQQHRYYCFGCHAHGDVITFLMQHVGMGFLEAVAELSDRVGVPLPEGFQVHTAPPPQTPTERDGMVSVPGVFGLHVPAGTERLGTQSPRKRFREPTKTWDAPTPVDPALLSQYREAVRDAAEQYHAQIQSAHARDYLHYRGITPDAVQRFHLGYADASSRVLQSIPDDTQRAVYEIAGMVTQKGTPAEWADRFRNRLMFPIRDAEGQFCGMGGRYIAPQKSGFGNASEFRPKYINTPETPIYHKSQMLYGLHEAATDIHKAGKVYVVEGYLDVIGLYQAGIRNAVASCGTAVTDAQIAQALTTVPAVIFCFDGDAAGQAAAIKIAEKCPEHLKDGVSIRVMHLPDGVDPDDLVRSSEGVDRFDALAIKAPPVLDVLLNALKERILVTDVQSAAAFLEEAGYYRDRIGSPSLREAWWSQVRESCQKYLPKERVSPDHAPSPPTEKRHAAGVMPHADCKSRALSESFLEGALWWLFNLPVEESIVLWAGFPVECLLYDALGSPATNALLVALRALYAENNGSNGITGEIQNAAQITSVRQVMERVAPRMDAASARHAMSLEERKAEVAGMVSKIARQARRRRQEFIALAAEKDGMESLSEEERALLKGVARTA